MNDKVDYSFIYELLPIPTCKSFTARDFSYVSSKYDFANNPPYNSCSSTERLVSVASERKSKTFPCVTSGGFNSCSFYDPDVKVIRKSDCSGKVFELIKIVHFDRFADTFVKQYVICNIELSIVYMNFSNIANEQDVESLFDSFVKETTTDDLGVVISFAVSEQSSVVQKNSYFSRLLSA